MLTQFVVFVRSLALICSGHRAVALENVALRQQLAVFKRASKCPSLRSRDRLFWMALAHVWQEWRTALFVVQPDTVVRWHRQWLRRRWTQRSTYARVGRPGTTATIRQLVEQMGAMNPLWGAELSPRTFRTFPRESSSRRRPVGLEMPILALIPRSGNVVWRPASDLR